MKDNKYDIDLFWTQGDDFVVPIAILSDPERFMLSARTKLTTDVNDACYKILKREHTTDCHLRMTA